MILKTKNRLFGRTKGRNKKKIFNNNYFETIQKYKLKKLYNSKKYILDIGSGYGETTIFLAKQYPEHKIIACEKYIDGNINLIKNIRTQKIKNIVIYPLYRFSKYYTVYKNSCLIIYLLKYLLTECVNIIYF